MNFRTNLLVAWSLVGIPLTVAFHVAPVRRLSVSTSLWNGPDKPSRVDIEKAAGQLVAGAGVEQGTVQGYTTKTESECITYGCMASNPELEKKLEWLTMKRPYPLFIMEKGVKIFGDLLRGSGQEPDNLNGSTFKEKLVVLGTGWGAASLLSDIDNSKYDVTVISPRNYFLFTPMLAGAGTGTVDIRSITQPIRNFNKKAKYLEAAATSVDPKTRTITCSGIVCGEFCDIEDFEVSYDRLVVAVGAQTATFGIEGVEEYCLFLKQVDDARRIRRKIVNLFEQANYPGQSEEQLRKLLTFVVAGAGPTGVELASELRDFVEEDGPRYYRDLLKYVSILVIEATPVVLRPFDKTLQDEAIKELTKPPKDPASGLFPSELTKILLEKPVKEVTENEIYLADGSVIPYGLAVWAGGIGPLPITLDIIKTLGEKQLQAQKVARGKIAVDPWCRAISGDGRIFGIGDCVCTQNNCLPATAQVAAQQGEFVAHLLNVGDLKPEYDEELMLPPRLHEKTMQDMVASVAVNSDEYVAPFQFLDLGILAYTGSLSALAQVKVDETTVKAKGQLGFGLWRSVYLMKQSSMRNRVLVFLDWMKVRLFGRDITSIE